eukprot:5514163-Prorocentrum_lima.AAC.1
MGTRQALHCARRVADLGESTQLPVYMIFLDWKMAFDKVAHDRLLTALRRLDVPDKMVQAIH